MVRIQQLREAAKISANELAKRANISPSKLSKIEHDRLKLKLADAIQLARVLGCNADDLMADDACQPVEEIAHA